MDIALACIGVNISIMLYLTTCLPYIAKVTEDWTTYCPKLIPVMTLSGVLSFFCGLLGLWPIWGFLTPIFMIVLFMGYTMSLTFLPSGFVGTLLFWVLMFALASTSHFIPHERVW